MLAHVSFHTIFGRKEHSTLLQIIRDNQRRIADLLQVSLPSFTIWDPIIPEARVADPKKRGLIPSKQYGPLSRLYCIECGKPSPIAAPESMLKVFFKCNSCVQRTGAPKHGIPVPGSEPL